MSDRQPRATVLRSLAAWVFLLAPVLVCAVMKPAASRIAQYPVDAMVRQITQIGVIMDRLSSAAPLPTDSDAIADRVAASLPRGARVSIWGTKIAYAAAATWNAVVVLTPVKNCPRLVASLQQTGLEVDLNNGGTAASPSGCTRLMNHVAVLWRHAN